MQQFVTPPNGPDAGSDDFNTRALYLQVKDRLLERITKGIWKPGDMLANEHSLARELKVADATVRRALQILDKAGYITRKQGRGTFVSDKESADAKRRHACVGESLHIIKDAIDESGSKNVPAKLQTSLQERIADALLKAGFSGEATP